MLASEPGGAGQGQADQGRAGPGSYGSAIIALDLGTSSTRAVVFSLEGRVLATAGRRYPLETPTPGQVVQDPATVLAAARSAVAEVVASVGAAAVAGVAVSSAMHGLIALDGQRCPLTPIITWADNRALAQAERLRVAGGLELHRRTGTPVHPMSPLTKLIWFREELPGIHTAAAHWVGIKDLLLLEWTGELVTDHSLASGTGLMDVHRLGWDPEALNLGGVRAEQLPELVPTRHVLPRLLPEVARSLGLPQATPVVAGAGDGPLANLGAGAVDDGVAVCSIGTSGALRVLVERPVVDERGSTFCYALTEDRWAVGGAVNCGGSTLDWIRSLLAADAPRQSDTALLDLAAQVPAGADGVVVVPQLMGERAPRWRSGGTGAIVGLQLHHHRGHLVRAAVEGVCLQLSLVLAALRSSGAQVDQVRATGGVFRHPLWSQVLAGVLDLPVVLPADVEGSSLGAALLGMDALGLQPAVRPATQPAVQHRPDLVPLARHVEPDPAAAAVYHRLRPVYEELAELLPATGRLAAASEASTAAPPLQVV